MPYKNKNYQAEWRENNKEKLAAQRKVYYNKNKTDLLTKYKAKYNEPDIKARKKSYYNVNKKAILAKAKVKYQAKKAAIAEAQKAVIPQSKL